MGMGACIHARDMLQEPFPSGGEANILSTCNRLFIVQAGKMKNLYSIAETIRKSRSIYSRSANHENQ